MDDILTLIRRKKNDLTKKQRIVAEAICVPYIFASDQHA